MALTSKIPPQAYTRDTLVKAIEWLSGQPAAVRERANSADLIVSHYLQSRRQAAFEPSPAFEAPKTDLKSLAQDLKQFDEPPLFPQAVPQSIPQPVPQPVPRPTRVQAIAEEHVETVVNQHRQDSLFRQQNVPQQQELRIENAAPSVRTTETTVKGVAWTVDPRSLAIARDLMEALNLSSEGEALRMLVSLGAERLRGLIS